MHLDPEATRIVLAIGVIVAVGAPRIVKTIWLPRDLKCKDVPPDQLTPKQVACFAEFDQKMQVIGFAPFATVTATALANTNFNRMYANPTDPARCFVMIVGAQQTSTTCVEFVTRYADGTRLSTKNTEFSSVFAPFPKRIVQAFPGATDPATLKSYHDRKSETLLIHIPEFRSVNSAIADFEDYNRRFCEYQEGKNYLRFDAKTAIYRATYRTALQGIVNYLNPIADNFTLARLGTGLLLGAGLPLSAVTLQARLAQFSTALTPVQLSLAQELMLPVASMLAGVAVGAIFTRKSFIWGILLGYLPAKFLGTTGLPVGLGISIGVIAHWTSRALLKRRKLV